MGKLDKTKENLNVDKLNHADRRELYDKFVESGGQVIDDRGDAVKNKKRSVYDREKQLAYKRMIEAKKKKASMQIRPDAARTAAQEKSAPREPGFLQTFTRRLIIRLRLFFLKVTDFSTVYFNNKFLDLYNNEYISSMMHMQMLYFELFSQDQNKGLDIEKELNSINGIYQDLTKKMNGLYNLKDLLEIVQAYTNAPESRHNVRDVRDQILKLFKKIHLLKAYQDSISAAFERSLLTHMRLTGNKSSYYSPKRKMLKNDIFNIFNRLYPALYWLFCKFQDKIIPPESPLIEEILGITAADRPGSRKKPAETAAAPGQEESKAAAEEKKEDKGRKDEISDEIKKGSQLMRHFDLQNIKKLRARYDEAKTFININDNDKLLMVYLMFQEFDKEYAFLLTTNKINYAQEYERKENINYKEKLLMISNDIKKGFSALAGYADSTQVYYTQKNEKPLSKDQYIEYNKKLSLLAAKRTQAANTARMAVAALMSSLSRILKILIEDIRGEKKIIENPRDTITFDVSVETNRKLNNKTIYEVLSYAYFFSSAFVHRLGINGELSGELEFITDAEKEASPAAAKDASAGPAGEPKETPAARPKIKDETSQTAAVDGSSDDKTIMDELDDFV